MILNGEYMCYCKYKKFREEAKEIENVIDEKKEGNRDRKKCYEVK